MDAESKTPGPPRGVGGNASNRPMKAAKLGDALNTGIVAEGAALKSAQTSAHDDEDSLVEYEDEDEDMDENPNPSEYGNADWAVMLSKFKDFDWADDMEAQEKLWEAEYANYLAGDKPPPRMRKHLKLIKKITDAQTEGGKSPVELWGLGIEATKAYAKTLGLSVVKNQKSKSARKRKADAKASAAPDAKKAKSVVSDGPGASSLASTSAGVSEAARAVSKLSVEGTPSTVGPSDSVSNLRPAAPKAKADGSGNDAANPQARAQGVSSEYRELIASLGDRALFASLPQSLGDKKLGPEWRQAMEGQIGALPRAVKDLRGVEKMSGGLLLYLNDEARPGDWTNMKMQVKVGQNALPVRITPFANRSFTTDWKLESVPVITPLEVVIGSIQAAFGAKVLSLQNVRAPGRDWRTQVWLLRLSEPIDSRKPPSVKCSGMTVAVLGIRLSPCGLCDSTNHETYECSKLAPNVI